MFEVELDYELSLIRASEKDSRVGSEKAITCLSSLSQLGVLLPRGPEGVTFLRGGEVFLES